MMRTAVTYATTTPADPEPRSSMAKRVYLAGPEVFLAEARDIGALRRAICQRHGLVGADCLSRAERQAVEVALAGITVGKHDGQQPSGVGRQHWQKSPGDPGTDSRRKTWPETRKAGRRAGLPLHSLRSGSVVSAAAILRLEQPRTAA
jgi:hypothetical protein